MRHIKLLLLATIIISSCGKNKPQFEHAGGVFSMCLDASPSTFIARDIADYYSATFTNNVLEGLISLDSKTLRPKPQLAKSFSVSSDGLEYSFVLREDVLFHPNAAFENDEARIFVAEDVIATFEKVCTKSATGEAPIAYTLIFENNVLGANDFFERKAKSISGIKYKKNVVTIKLISPDLNFMNKLAMISAAISAKEVIEKKLEATLCGTGPFMYDASLAKNAERMVLSKNTEYYLTDKKGNALPYLDSVVFYIENRKLEQLDLFEKGITQIIIELPPSRITEMLEGKIGDFSSIPPKYLLNDQAQLNTQYYGFNMTEARFKDIRVRQAFNYAVDRDKIIRESLKGQAYEAGIFGIVPPISSYFRAYDFTTVKEAAYSFDPIKAKALLAEAGYPNGVGFGSIDLMVNVGDIHTAVAEEFSKQIKATLNINVNFSGTTFEIKNNEASMARGQLYRLAWSADYLSPETFLFNFYGKLVPNSIDKPSTTNQTRYNNPAFDNYFEKGKAAKTEREQYSFYSKAEQELMKDPPIIVLWYAGVNEILQSHVRNLKTSPLQIIDLKDVYFKEWTKEEYQKHTK
jgi:oligopeptide transport system substrate-binding protein